MKRRHRTFFRRTKSLNTFLNACLQFQPLCNLFNPPPLYPDNFITLYAFSTYIPRFLLLESRSYVKRKFNVRSRTIAQRFNGILWIAAIPYLRNAFCEFLSQERQVLEVIELCFLTILRTLAKRRLKWKMKRGNDICHSLVCTIFVSFFKCFTDKNNKLVANIHLISWKVSSIDHRMDTVTKFLEKLDNFYERVSCIVWEHFFTFHEHCDEIRLLRSYWWNLGTVRRFIQKLQLIYCKCAFNGKLVVQH